MSRLANLTETKHRGDKADFTNSQETIISRLNSIDWNFHKAKTQYGVHKIHPYPAKFIPQIPQHLIRMLHPGDDSPVLDPFCGSGTTLVEALLAGLPGVGIDLNPLAILITKVKTTPLSRPIEPVLKDILQSARTGKFPIPEIPRLDHWFSAEVQAPLAGLVNKISQIKDQDIRDALMVILSSIIVRVSNQESDTRYAAIKKDIKSEDVFKLFENAASSISKAIQETFGELFRPRHNVSLLCKDLLSLKPEEVGRDIGLVITSPPYPNAYEYWLYHKYRMYWLGMDPISVREKEIGARPHYFKKNPQTEKDFEKQMQRCFWLLSKVMRKEAKACFLIGRSVIHGRVIDNVELLTRAACSNRFQRMAVIERNIPSTRKAFNPAHGKINKEKIVVFSLGDK